MSFDDYFTDLSKRSFETEQHDDYNEIPLNDNQGKLYIGSLYSLIHVDKLKIDYVLSLCPITSDMTNVNTCTYQYIDIDDDGDFNTTKTMNYILDDIVPQIITRIKNKQKVMIHCFAGISRSSTVVSYIVSQMYNWHPKEAVSYVSKYRSCICPNYFFLKLLFDKFEKNKPSTNC